MSNPSPQSLSRLQKKLKSLSQQVATYHEQLDRLRDYVVELTIKLDDLDEQLADKQTQLDTMNTTYREKHLAWLDTLTGMQARADILRARITRLEREETEINERLGAKQKADNKAVNAFLALD